MRRRKVATALLACMALALCALGALGQDAAQSEEVRKTALGAACLPSSASREGGMAGDGTGAAGGPGGMKG